MENISLILLREVHFNTWEKIMLIGAAISALGAIIAAYGYYSDKDNTGVIGGLIIIVGAIVVTSRMWVPLLICVLILGAILLVIAILSGGGPPRR